MWKSKLLLLLLRVYVEAVHLAFPLTSIPGVTVKFYSIPLPWSITLFHKIVLRLLSPQNVH